MAAMLIGSTATGARAQAPVPAELQHAVNYISGLQCTLTFWASALAQVDSPPLPLPEWTPNPNARAVRKYFFELNAALDGPWSGLIRARGGATEFTRWRTALDLNNDWDIRRGTLKNWLPRGFDSAAVVVAGIVKNVNATQPAPLLPQADVAQACMFLRTTESGSVQNRMALLERVKRSPTGPVYILGVIGLPKPPPWRP